MKKHSKIYTTLCLAIWIGIANSQLVSQIPDLLNKETSNRMILKTAPFGPLIGKFGLTLEKGRINNDNRSLEFTAGLQFTPLIFRNLSDELKTTSFGFYLQGGPKLYFGKQEFSIEGMKRTNRFYGKYLKPEIGFEFKNIKEDYVNEVDKKYTESLVHLSLLFGKQYVTDNFTFEYYGGLGYALRFNSMDNQDDYYKINIPMKFQLGIRIGIIN